MRLTMMKLSGIGIIAFFCVFACTAPDHKQQSLQEEAYFKEVMKRRIQGRHLIQCGIFLTQNDTHQKVYNAMASYYDRTDCLFASLQEDYPTLAQLEDEMVLEYMEISDFELVHVLQMHIDATLQLYRGGIAKNIHEEYKNNLLLLMPALLAQHEDLKVLQHMSETNQYIKVK